MSEKDYDYYAVYSYYIHERSKSPTLHKVLDECVGVGKVPKNHWAFEPRGDTCLEQITEAEYETWLEFDIPDMSNAIAYGLDI